MCIRDRSGTKRACWPISGCPGQREHIIYKIGCWSISGCPVLRYRVCAGGGTGGKQRHAAARTVGAHAPPGT
eukprot:2032548-Rhodomonas_salina.2